MVTNSKNQGQTGPKTLAGKNRSKFNALKSGMYAKSKLLPYEDQKEYDRHLQSVMDGLDPQDFMQVNLAAQIADSLWRGNRQEVRAALQREKIFMALTPKMMAKLLGVQDERAEHAPGFLVQPNHRFGRKALKLHRDLYSHYQSWQRNSKGVANYEMVWRNHGDLFIHLGHWMKPQISPELMMSGGRGIDLVWQQHPKKLEDYLVAYGHYLWYVVNFEELRGSIRNWMATWYFVNSREAEHADVFDDIMIRERRVGQSLLDSYIKLRKSQIEFTAMRHTQLVIGRPNPLKGMSFDGEWKKPVVESSPEGNVEESANLQNEMEKF
jgi:hypothetical protein